MTRLLEAWRTMDPERRFAALAALGLFVSMFLPWYQQNGIAGKNLESRNLDAFQVFSFVEAAVLLVAVALLYMLYARADGREFNMPGGDGTIVLAAGAWVAALLVLRLFDKPGISTHGIAANVGVQWGIFFALAAAGMIVYAGSRMRAARAGTRAGRHRSHPVPAEREHRPAAEEQAADETRQTRVIAPGRRPPARTAEAPSRPRYPPTPSEQLSFEDPPTRAD